jgi:hypothetical protein
MVRKPIRPISIYKLDDEVGFGKPNSDDDNVFIFQWFGR